MAVSRFTNGEYERLAFNFENPKDTRTYCDLKLYFNDAGKLFLANRYSYDGNLIERILFSEIDNELRKIESYNILKNNYHYWILNDTTVIEKGNGVSPNEISEEWNYNYEDDKLMNVVKLNRRGKIVFEQIMDYNTSGDVIQIIQKKRGKIKWYYTYEYEDQKKIKIERIFKTLSDTIPYYLYYYIPDTLNTANHIKFFQTTPVKRLKAFITLAINGKTDEVMVYKKDNSFYSKTYYSYNEKNKILSEEFYASENNFSRAKRYYYNTSGDLTLYEFFEREKDNLVYREVFEYNEKGNISRQVIYDKNRKMKTFYNYEYIENNLNN